MSYECSELSEKEFSVMVRLSKDSLILALSRVVKCAGSYLKGYFPFVLRDLGEGFEIAFELELINLFFRVMINSSSSSDDEDEDEGSSDCYFY